MAGGDFVQNLMPDHFENDEWKSGGYSNRTRPFNAGEVEIGEADEIMRRVEMEELEWAATTMNGVSLKLLDTTVMLLLRLNGDVFMN